MNVQLLIVEMFSKVLHHSGMRQTTKRTGLANGKIKEN